ncbi:MAG: class I SAM-dependent methyltransferase [Candidatus Lernaella stagnicola]|nr:class I SAM-dependent methyltransferase [Candidatus Lernaella stagnicola]
MSNKNIDLLVRLQSLADKEPHPNSWCFFPWDDPEISRRTLALHLNPEHDQASRQPDQVEAETAFLDGLFTDTLSQPARICDLTCGPGLYAMRFAQMGHKVTGVDFAPAAIEHARAEAAKRKLAIDFVLEDARRVDFAPQSFDAVYVLYAQANAFPEDDFRRLLSRIRSWIAPGGVLVLDLASRWQLMEDIGRSWMVCERSIFCDSRHLWLEEKRFFRTRNTQVHRVFTLDLKTERLTECSIWHRAYEPPEIENILRECGWRLESLFGDLLGNPYREGRTPWLVTVARPDAE